MNLYRNESSYPKVNAQRNLCGRTHYVDDDTLRFHHSRILSTHIVDQGLLFALVESMSTNFENTKRGYRYVIFDIFGQVIERPNMQESYTSSKAATKAMWAALNAINAREYTIAEADKQAKAYVREIADLTLLVQNLDNEKAA